MGLGGEHREAAGDPLAVQVARLDERTIAVQAQLGRVEERLNRLADTTATKGELAQLRGEMRMLVGGVYLVVVLGMTALGWLVLRIPH